MQSFRRAFLMGADELADTPTDGIHVNCSVAGVVVLIMADGSKLPMAIPIGVTSGAYACKGYTATGSSGTFTVYGLGL